jgi:integrase
VRTYQDYNVCCPFGQHKETHLSVQKLGDGKYKVRWRELGRARARTFDYKRDAESYDAEVKRRLRLGEVGIVDGARMTLGELHDQWKDAHFGNLAPATVESYDAIWIKHVEPKLGMAKLGELRTQTIQRFSDELIKKGVGVATVRRILVVLGAMFRFAEEQEMVNRNPVRSVRKPRSNGRQHEIVALSPAQVEALRSELRLHRDRTIVSMLCYVGLRPGELLHLRWRGLNEDRLYVRGSISNGVEKTTKTGKTRTVKLLSPVVQDLREWTIACGRPGDSELIFPMQDGRAWTAAKYRNWSDRIFEPAVQRAGLPKIRVYDCRHACASLWLAAGRNPVAIAEQLGNSPGTLLSAYSHIIDEYEERSPIDPAREILNARTTSMRRSALNNRTAQPYA